MKTEIRCDIDMTKIFAAIENGKGGVGKSTFAQLLIEYFLFRLLSPLVIQVDAQARLEPLILARSNAQIRQIALAVRDDCRSVGELGEDMVGFTGRANDRVFAMSLGLGDRIRFNVKVNDLEVVNGTTALVTAIIPAPEPLQTVVVALVGNREIRFKLADLANEKGQVGLSWSYASTIFAAQGLTVDETLVLADAGFDRSAAYVACSRARERTTLFVDRSTLESLEQFEPGPPDSRVAARAG